MKETARKISETLKPYEKYVGMLAIGLAIDHFILKGKFRDRFIKLAEATVNRITASLDALIKKISPEVEIEELDDQAAEATKE